MTLYDTNVDFKNYVDKYCTKTGISVGEALEHYVVKDVEKYYASDNRHTVHVDICHMEQEDKSC